jgi:hypothetical protein
VEVAGAVVAPAEALVVGLVAVFDPVLVDLASDCPTYAFPSG